MGRHELRLWKLAKHREHTPYVFKCVHCKKVVYSKFSQPQEVNQDRMRCPGPKEKQSNVSI